MSVATNFENGHPECGDCGSRAIENLEPLTQERDRLKEALVHLVEVQTAPSFEKPAEHDTQAMGLYLKQAEEWTAALHDARRALRG